MDGHPGHGRGSRPKGPRAGRRLVESQSQDSPCAAAALGHLLPACRFTASLDRRPRMYNYVAVFASAGPFPCAGSFSHGCVMDDPVARLQGPARQGGSEAVDDAHKTLHFLQQQLENRSCPGCRDRRPCWSSLVCCQGSRAIRPLVLPHRGCSDRDTCISVSMVWWRCVGSYE